MDTSVNNHMHFEQSYPHSRDRGPDCRDTRQPCDAGMMFTDLHQRVPMGSCLDQYARHGFVALKCLVSLGFASLLSLSVLPMGSLLNRLDRRHHGNCPCTTRQWLYSLESPPLPVYRVSLAHTFPLSRDEASRTDQDVLQYCSPLWRL